MNKIFRTWYPQLAVPDVLFVCACLFLPENVADMLASAVEIFILWSYL